MGQLDHRAAHDLSRPAGEFYHHDVGTPGVPAYRRGHCTRGGAGSRTILGRKNLYNIGFVIFTVGSLLCGLSLARSSTALTCWWYRMIQGVGGALLTDQQRRDRHRRLIARGTSASPLG